MFKSDNVGNMNVSTVQFQANRKFLTLVTLDGKPWDYLEADTVNDAEVNHAAMMLACYALPDVLATVGMPVDRSNLN